MPTLQLAQNESSLRLGYRVDLVDNLVKIRVATSCVVASMVDALAIGSEFCTLLLAAAAAAAHQQRLIIHDTHRRSTGRLFMRVQKLRSINCGDKLLMQKVGGSQDFTMMSHHASACVCACACLHAHKREKRQTNRRPQKHFKHSLVLLLACKLIFQGSMIVMMTSTMIVKARASLAQPQLSAH